MKYCYLFLLSLVVWGKKIYEWVGFVLVTEKEMNLNSPNPLKEEVIKLIL